MQLGKVELGCSIDSDEQVQLPLFGAQLRDGDVELADRITLELLLRFRRALEVWQARDLMAPIKSVKARANVLGNRLLQGIKAVILGQRHVPSEGNKDGFVLRRQDRRTRILRTRWRVLHGRALTPFANSLLVQSVLFGDLRDCRFRLLYRCADGVLVVAQPRSTWPIAPPFLNVMAIYLYTPELNI